MLFRSVAYAWNGTLILIPSFDNHGDVNNTGSINITVDNTKPWRDFANSPMAYTWGDWRTTTNVVSTSVVTGTQDITNLTINVGTQSGHVSASQAVLNYMLANYGPASIHGLNVTTLYLGTEAQQRFYFA